MPNMTHQFQIIPYAILCDVYGGGEGGVEVIFLLYAILGNVYGCVCAACAFFFPTPTVLASLAAVRGD
jgi:hypothetical protein